MMRIFCSLEGCDEPAGGYRVEVPNPDRAWCKECHQQIGDITLTYYFCSSEHALEWLQEYIHSAKQTVSE